MLILDLRLRINKQFLKKIGGYKLEIGRLVNVTKCLMREIVGIKSVKELSNIIWMALKYIQYFLSTNRKSLSFSHKLQKSVTSKTQQ